MLMIYFIPTMLYSSPKINSIKLQGYEKEGENYYLKVLVNLENTASSAVNTSLALVIARHYQGKSSKILTRRNPGLVCDCAADFRAAQVARDRALRGASDARIQKGGRGGHTLPRRACRRNPRAHPKSRLL
jgi:hypothetical protein